tara:strand:- start:904 stop:1149 length:246 start_codon:yes stop_codon:yes gene_type:complete
MAKYSKDFIKILVEEKSFLTVSEIAAKHGLTERQATYVIYKLGRREENMSLCDIYRRLRKLSDDIRKKNKTVARLIKLLSK